MADSAPAKTAPASEKEIQARAFQARRAALDAEAAMTSADGVSALSEWKRGKLTAILEANSFDAINKLMTDTGLTASKSLVGRTLVILGFELRESADQYRENSELQKVAYVKCADTSTGEEFVMDAGGDQVVGGLISMRDSYDFPFTGTLLSITTGSGNEMLYWRFHNPGRDPQS